MPDFWKRDDKNIQMELNLKTLLKIFPSELGYEVVDTCVGKAIKMPAIDAYLFANVTGASYLDNPIYPFTPKGTTKILREAFRYNFVTGIFDNGQLLYSPSVIRANRVYLFEGDKYVLLQEFNDESSYREAISSLIDEITNCGFDSRNFLVYRIETSKDGNGMEPFLEYLACEYFKRKGYIVENQIPLTHTVGSPDFGGFKLKVGKRGFHLIELAMMRITGEYSLADELTIEHLIVGEAKTATTDMAGQLAKYLNTTIFAKGYEMHPYKSEPSFSYYGLFNIGSDYKVKCREPKTPYANVGNKVFQINEYLHWYRNYLKLYIVANLTNDELKAMVTKRVGKYSVENLISTIDVMQTDEIMKWVKGN